MLLLKICNNVVQKIHLFVHKDKHWFHSWPHKLPKGFFKRLIILLHVVNTGENQII